MAGGELRWRSTRARRVRSDDTETKTIAPDVALSLAEGIDATTPAGKLQMHILAAIAEFERERIRERVMAGLKRAREQGRRLGRPRREISARQLSQVSHLSIRQAAQCLEVPRSTLQGHLAGKPLAAFA